MAWFGFGKKEVKAEEVEVEEVEVEEVEKIYTSKGRIWTGEPYRGDSSKYEGRRLWEEREIDDIEDLIILISHDIEDLDKYKIQYEANDYSSLTPVDIPTSELSSTYREMYDYIQDLRKILKENGKY